jgi:nucleoside-diphosphate-sugar epimerase
MTRVLIAGCGDLGTEVGLRLAAAGHEVWGLRRRASGLPDPIRPLAMDLCCSESLEALSVEPELVVISTAADRFDAQAYRAAYVTAPTKLLSALRSRGCRPRRVLFVSSTSVYDRDDGGWVDERSPTHAEGFAARALLAGEEQVLQSGWPATVIRFGGIYGPGRTRLLEQLRRGAATCTEGVYSNRIHRDDCARAILHLLALPGAEPIYVGVDREPAMLCEVMDWLARRLGVAPPARAEAAPGSRRMRANKRCSSARLQASGFEFLYPSYREGYSALLTREVSD